MTKCLHTLYILSLWVKLSSFACFFLFLLIMELSSLSIRLKDSSFNIILLRKDKVFGLSSLLLDVKFLEKCKIKKEKSKKLIIQSYN